MIEGIFLDWFGVIQTFSFKIYFEELNKLIIIEKTNMHNNNFTVNNYNKLRTKINMNKLSKEEKQFVLSTDKIKKEFRKSYDLQKKGDIKIREHYKLLCKHLDIEYRENLLRFYISLLPYASQKFNEPLLKLVKKLHHKFPKLKFAILSNGSKELCYNQKRIITQFGLNFIKFYSSAELKISKPDKRFFKIALEHFKLKPNQVIYVDDQVKNTKPTRDMGFNVIQYEYPKYEGKRLVKDILTIISKARLTDKPLFINEEGVLFKHNNDLY